MDDRKQPLRAAVECGRLVLSIGVDALMDIVTAADDWEPDQIRIVDADAYALAIGQDLIVGPTYDDFLKVAIEEAAVVSAESGDCGVEDL